ncbi:hypothetical protein EUGRSUZ_E01140 [Eucalyptus grandis]|uniref:Uncharacterized protein n=2 Tax=Eucalyptus grandis TaxID=71139 RepID=A0A059C357_EUCGR|nr:hypothetical protein EUGRSUZ_E01140 [Eucalyptus grandis]
MTGQNRKRLDLMEIPEKENKREKEKEMPSLFIFPWGPGTTRLASNYKKVMAWKLPKHMSSRTLRHRMTSCALEFFGKKGLRVRILQDVKNWSR